MKGKSVKAQRGMADQLPAEIGRWQHVQGAYRDLVTAWGYDEIRTPIIEDRDLFIRSSGDTSEVVSKQMYEFMDKGERLVALRPEGTAGVMRAVLEHNLLQGALPLRLWYFNQHFRYERPQKGRLRQHHQLGLELIGSPSPLADAEIIELAVTFLTNLGLSGLEVLVNCIGRAESRGKFRDAILAHIDAWLKDQTSEDRAQAEKNPLRLFDSKIPAVNELMADAPLISDFLEESSRLHIDGVLRDLDSSGVKCTYDPRIVRGLDYYTDTVFEIQSNHLGAQSTVCGGGRYDGLIEELGGPATPSVGFGMGVERLLLVLEGSGIEAPEPKPAVYVAAMGDAASTQAKQLVRELRAMGLRAVRDLDGKGLKQQFKQADRLGAKKVLVLGDDEIASGNVTVKDMATGTQQTLHRLEAIASLAP